MSYTTRKTCRLCGHNELTPLLSLGKQYVSDFVEPDNQPCLSERVPIDLTLCKACSLVQLKHTADPSMYKHYWYRSGVTQTMRDALKDVADYAMSLVKLKRGDVVLDIGSNDGTLLKFFPRGCVRVGVEPAANVTKNYREDGLELIQDFWCERKYFACVTEIDYDAMSSIKAKVVTALGMMYDLEDPNKFVADIAKVLAPDGVFVAQLMCLKNMVNVNDVGNLCHEHLEFYSMRSLHKLYNDNGLRIIDVQKNAVNGESYRITAVHDKGLVVPHPSVTYYKGDEQGLDDPKFYERFYDRMEINRRKVVGFIIREHTRGKKFWVYGASTKGNTILQYYDLDKTLIDGAAERSPEKWGKRTVGTDIPIFSEEDARKANPDYFIVLPFAFLDEFLVREKAFRERGGKFLVPLPEMRIV